MSTSKESCQDRDDGMMDRIERKLTLEEGEYLSTKFRNANHWAELNYNGWQGVIDSYKQEIVRCKKAEKDWQDAETAQKEEEAKAAEAKWEFCEAKRTIKALMKAASKDKKQHSKELAQQGNEINDLETN
jgi:hypothetical protein